MSDGPYPTSSQLLEAKDNRIEELERENARLRAVLRDVANCNERDCYLTHAAECALKP